MACDFNLGLWAVFPLRNRIDDGERAIQLEPKVMQVLVCLAKRHPSVVTKQELLETVWPNVFVTDDVLKRSIFELRKALNDDSKAPKLIETIPRTGYRLIAPPLFQGDEAARRNDQVAKVRALIPRPWKSWVVAGAAVVVAIGLWVSGHLRQPFTTLRDRPPAIVVLPFKNLSGDAGEEYFSDGLTEEVISEVAARNAGSMRVISRTSAMHYKNTSETVQEIGRDLGVDWVLEGSAMRAGTRVRITAQLIRVADQSHVWAETYDRELRDVLGVQADVGRAVELAIEGKLIAPERAVVAVDPEAYEHYLKGRYFLDFRTVEALQKSRVEFQRSVDKAPDFAPAWAGLAQSYELIEYERGISPREAYPSALAATSRALQLSPRLAEGHTALAYIRQHYEWKWAEADEELKVAMRLNPNYALARQWYSWQLLQLGNAPAAVEEMRHAIMLDPASPRVYITMASRLEATGQYDQAAHEYLNALELAPENPWARWRLVDVYVKLGKHDDAKREYEVFLRSTEGLEAVARFDAEVTRRGFPSARAMHERAIAISALRQLQGKARMGLYTSPADFAELYIRLGEQEKAMDWLERAYAEHSSAIIELRDRRYDPVRNMPRFQAIFRSGPWSSDVRPHSQ